jgi:hypothetical protein
MKINPASLPLTNPVLERIAQATSRVLRTSGKSAASVLLMTALEQEGLYDLAHPNRSKLKGWELMPIVDRAMFLSQEVAQ